MLVTFKPGTFGGKGEDWELASLGIFAKGEKTCVNLLLEFTDCISSVIFFSKQDCPFLPHGIGLHSVMSDSATPWTVTLQAAQSMGFSRQEYWSGLPFLSPGDLPDPGMKPRSPVLQAGATREATFYLIGCFFFFYVIVNDLLKPIPVSQKNEICSSTSVFVFPSPSLPKAHTHISDSAFLFQLVVAFMTSHFQSYYK